MIVIEVLCEKGIIIIIIMRIIRAGTAHVSNSFNCSWNPKCIDFRFWSQAKVEGISDKRGTSANYSDHYYYALFT